MTLISKEFDDIYFSKESGIEETRYVFLEGNNLPNAWKNKPHYNIFETGFGTGLNFLTTAKLFEETAQSGQTLDFISVEKYPLSAEIIKEELQQWNTELPHLSKLLEQYPIRVEGVHPINITPNIRLILYIGDINAILPDCANDHSIDTWFLDGFTPAKNPEMWSETLFASMKRLSHCETTFATFTAAGDVKRGLKSAGFVVQKQKGFGRKRDMLIGKAEDSAPNAPEKTIKNDIHVGIIGGGLAGCSLAWRLHHEGISSEIIEQSEAIAQKASGNPLGLISPKLTAIQTAHSLYYTSAYALILREGKHASARFDLSFSQPGHFYSAHNDDKTRRYKGYIKNLGWHADHIQWKTQEEVSQAIHNDLAYPCIYYPDAALISPPRLCEYYAQNTKKHCSTVVHNIEKTQSGWRLEDKNQNTIGEYTHIVFANAYNANKLTPLQDLYIQKVRGQISRVSTNKNIKDLKHTLCFGGYLTPPMNKQNDHILGASFKPWDDDEHLKEEDDQMNAEKFHAILPDILNDSHIHSERISFRASSKDHFPIVSAIPDMPDAYASICHGSHGLISTSLASMILSTTIAGRFVPTYATMTKSLFINRFRKQK